MSEVDEDSITLRYAGHISEAGHPFGPENGINTTIQGEEKSLKDG